jgi:hypothetical protein
MFQAPQARRGLLQQQPRGGGPRCLLLRPVHVLDAVHPARALLRRTAGFDASCTQLHALDVNASASCEVLQCLRCASSRHSSARKAPWMSSTGRAPLSGHACQLSDGLPDSSLKSGESHFFLKSHLLLSGDCRVLACCPHMQARGRMAPTHRRGCVAEASRHCSSVQQCSLPRALLCRSRCSRSTGPCMQACPLRNCTRSGGRLRTTFREVSVLCRLSGTTGPI